MHNHLISSTFCIVHPFECLYTFSPSSKSYLVQSFVHIPNLLSVLSLQHVQSRCSTTKRRYIYWPTILIDMHNHLISHQNISWSPIRMSPCLFFGLNNWSGTIFCVDSKFTVSFIATTCPDLEKHHEDEVYYGNSGGDAQSFTLPSTFYLSRPFECPVASSLYSMTNIMLNFV